MSEHLKQDTVMVERRYRRFAGGVVSKGQKRALVAECEDETTDFLEVHRFVTATATATIKVGGTFSMPNYENLKYEITVSLPCYREELDETLDLALEMANERFKVTVDDTKQYMDESRAKASGVVVRKTPPKDYGDLF